MAPSGSLLLLSRKVRNSTDDWFLFFLRNVYVRTVLTALGPKIEAMSKVVGYFRRGDKCRMFTCISIAPFLRVTVPLSWIDIRLGEIKLGGQKGRFEKFKPVITALLDDDMLRTRRRWQDAS